MLVEKSSYRVCVMIGCAGMGISLTIAGLTTSFPVFFLMYGILAGETSYKCRTCIFSVYAGDKNSLIAFPHLQLGFANRVK